MVQDLRGWGMSLEDEWLRMPGVWSKGLWCIHMCARLPTCIYSISPLAYIWGHFIAIRWKSSVSKPWCIQRKVQGAVWLIHDSHGVLCRRVSSLCVITHVGSQTSSLPYYAAAHASCPKNKHSVASPLIINVWREWKAFIQWNYINSYSTMELAPARDLCSFLSHIFQLRCLI